MTALHTFDTENEKADRFTPRFQKFYPIVLKGITHQEVVPGLDPRNKKGVDVVLYRTDGSTLNIENKIRTVDYTDMALEIWSNKEAGKPGWAVDDSKVSDFLCYGIAPNNKIYWLPYKALRRAVQKNHVVWKEMGYGRYISAENNGYTSECLCMPLIHLVPAVIEEYPDWSHERTVHDWSFS